MKAYNKYALAAALMLAAPVTAQKSHADEKLSPVKVTFVDGTSAESKEGAPLVVDGHKWTKWCLDEPQKMPYQVTVDAGKQIALKGYALTTAEDTHTYPTRNPISWNIYGSNDCKEWQLVKQVKYNRDLRDENEQTYKFSIKDSKAWRYYKFEFTRMTEGTRMQLAEIGLYE